MPALHAETGADGWLRYAPIQEEIVKKQYAAFPSAIICLSNSVVIFSAQTETIRGVDHMLGKMVRVLDKAALPNEDALVLGTVEDMRRVFPNLPSDKKFSGDGFWLKTTKAHGHSYLIIAGANDRGVLYGTFALLRKIAQQESLSSLDEVETPYAPIRWVNQWDNLDGSIERGYAGRSIFFENSSVRGDLTRAGDYARLLASVGINGCTVNNVNANLHVLQDDFLPQLARIANAFRPWGVQLSLSVDVSSPQAIGGLNTFDPLDPRVAEWWRKKVDNIYRQIPDFGGFVVKADSEGRSGPSTYGRTPADAANVIARAIKPHGGAVFYRAFVYNHHLDWRNLKNDRAKAAYDNFHPLDGKFDDNVIVQIKYGPIDFQVREPVSPLFGGLAKTNGAIELQVTQEYTGQQRHLCFLVPMWKQTLDFDMHVSVKGEATPVKEIVAGKTFHRPLGGFVAVTNVGMDANWLGHPLAMANLYGFGRLAWNPNLSSAAIAEEWTRLTFGNDPLVVRTISGMELASWGIYESYTGPLGIGTLTDITGPHYGPGVESSERNGWGQWHRADHEGVGMDRTMATGTGYIGQYSPPVQQLYETLSKCPDELLLFMHHVPYAYVLHSGKTVIQHIYDSHYEGAERAEELVKQWKTLSRRIDEDRYSDVLQRLEYQVGHAIVWRDAVNNWFFRISGIPDDKGRVGNDPDRIEAEAMQLQGYIPVDVIPWETASGGKAVICKYAVECSASFVVKRPEGRYDISVEYFDQNNGVSRFELLVNEKSMSAWSAADHFPSDQMNGHTSTRQLVEGIELRPGDVLRIKGWPDQGENAALDYVEVSRHRD
ncbi:MAG TPA: alpha-glucuronidase family glycosyl hydrolase [Terriglobales bacterium]|nr:alpha-glucuronidase family glycosyl hydrolase [Terriglobales bacterium]